MAALTIGGKISRKARKKTPPKLPQTGDLLSVMARAQIQIQKCSRQIAKSTIERFDAANLVLRHPDITPALARTFLEDAGIHEEDIEAFMNFATALENRNELLPAGGEFGDVGDFLIEHDVPFPVIASLMKADTETIRKAFAIISARVTLSHTGIASLAEHSRRNGVPGRELLWEMHQQNLQAATDRLAHEYAQEWQKTFQHDIAILLNHLQAYVANRADVPNDSGGFEEYVSSGKVNPEHFRQLEGQIVTQASAIIPLFDQIFPNARIAEDDWLDFMDSNPVALEIAQARVALSRISKCILPDDLVYVVGLVSWNAISVFQNLLSSLGNQRDPKKTYETPYEASRPSARRFNALAFSPGTGATIPAIEAAGFRVRAVYQDKRIANETLNSNRPGDQWPIVKAPITDAVRSAIKDVHRVDVPINLIVGSLPVRPWQRQQTGANTSDNLFSVFTPLVRQMLPEMFFAETASELMLTRHARFRRALIEECNSFGYHLAFFEIDAAEYGLAQSRERTVVIGVRRSIGVEVSAPVVAGGKPTTLTEFVENVLYPDRGTSIIANTGYENWKSSLPSQVPKFTPDVTTLLYVNKAVERQWAEAGFDIGGLTKPSYRPWLSNKRHVLTLADVRALQGIPCDWVIKGDLKEQLEQICNTTPPVIMRVVTQSLQSVLAGVPVKLSNFLNQPISIFSPRRFGRFRPMLCGDGYDKLDDLKRQHRHQLLAERAADEAMMEFERRHNRDPAEH